MNTIEQAKTLKQLKALIEQKHGLDGLALAKVLRDIIELRQKLGMQVESSSNLPESIILTGSELGEFPDTPEGKKELRAAAKLEFEKLLGQWVDCPALDAVEGEGTKVEIRKRGLKEFMAFSGDTRKLKLVAAIANIIKTAKLPSDNSWQENGKIDKKPMVSGYYHLANMIQIDGQELNIRIVIEKDEKGLLHYDVIVPKIIKGFDGICKKMLGAAIPDNYSGVTPSNNITSQGENLVNQFDAATGQSYVLNLFIEGEENADNEIGVQSGNLVFESIINGEKSLSIETIQEALEEGEANPQHYQLVPAVQKLLDDFTAQQGFDSVADGDDFDSWLRDGHFDQIALSELKKHSFADLIKNKHTSKNLILVQETKAHHFKILIGWDIFLKAAQNDLEFVPCIILREGEGFTDKVIKDFIQKNHNVAYDAQSFALALDDVVANEAALNLPG